MLLAVKSQKAIELKNGRTENYKIIPLINKKIEESIAYAKVMKETVDQVAPFDELDQTPLDIEG
jgi:uncharacterized protein YaaR (DUF327 family)